MASFTAAVRDDIGWTPLDRVLHYIDNAEEAPNEQLDVALYLIDCDSGVDRERAKLLSKACFLLSKARFWGRLDLVKEVVEQHTVAPSSECCYVC